MSQRMTGAHRPAFYPMLRSSLENGDVGKLQPVVLVLGDRLATVFAPFAWATYSKSDFPEATKGHVVPLAQ
jgi:hypothetical protein